MPNNVVESLDLPDGAAYIVLKPTDGGFKAMLFDLLKDEDKDLGVIARGLMELVDNNANVVLSVGLTSSVMDQERVKEDTGVDEYLVVVDEAPDNS